MAKKGQRFRTFSPEYKEKAVRMHLAGKATREVARDLGLPGHDYVCRWVKLFKEKGRAGLEDQRGRRGGINLGAARSKRSDLRIKWLEAEVALLKKLVAWERRNARKRQDFSSSES